MPRRKGDAWFRGCENHPTCTPPVPRNLKMLLLYQAVNDRIPAKGCRHLLVKPWANGTGNGNTCQLCGGSISDKDEITGTSKAIQRRPMTAERTLAQLDLVQDEIDEAKRLLEEAHLEVQAAQSKVTEATCRVGEAMEEMAKIRSQPIDENKSEETLAGWYQKKECVERWYEVIEEEERLQSNKDITVQCIDSCEVTTA